MSAIYLNDCCVTLLFIYRPDLETLFALCVKGSDIPKPNEPFVIDMISFDFQGDTVTLSQFVQFW